MRNIALYSVCRRRKGYFSYPKTITTHGQVWQLLSLTQFQLFVIKSNVNSINSSNIMKNYLLFSIEQEEILEWVDPFDSIILKLLMPIIYIIEILASAIFLTFVLYETKGYAGHYRTVINQILSSGYAAVRYSLKFRKTYLAKCR